MTKYIPEYILAIVLFLFFNYALIESVQEERQFVD